MGSNRDWGVQSSSLTLPPFAGPNDPRIFIGPDIPPELVLWGSTHATTFLAVEIYYYDATHYYFQGIGTFGGTTTYFEGTYDPLNTVYITNRIILSGGVGLGSVEQRIGSNSLNTFALAINYQQANLSIDSASQLSITGAFRIDTRSAGRGILFFSSNSLATAAIGAAETVVGSLPGSYTLKANRAIEFGYCGFFGTSVLNTPFQVLLRANTLVGANYLFSRKMSSVAGNAFRYHDAVVMNVGGAAIGLTDFVMTLSVTAGTVTGAASTVGPRQWWIRDVGADVDYPGAPVI